MGFKQTKKTQKKVFITKNEEQQRDILVHINRMKAWHRLFTNKAELFVEEMDEAKNDGDRLIYGHVLNFLQNLIDSHNNHLKFITDSFEIDFAPDHEIVDKLANSDILDSYMEELFEKNIAKHGKDPKIYMKLIDLIEDESTEDFMECVDKHFPHYKHMITETTFTGDDMIKFNNFNNFGRSCPN